MHLAVFDTQIINMEFKEYMPEEIRRDVAKSATNVTCCIQNCRKRIHLLCE